MLTYNHLHKEVAYYKSITGGKLPQRVWVYVQEDNYKLQQIPVNDFGKYNFVRYTYANSPYPDVTKTKP
jgi:hypothetical protein